MNFILKIRLKVRDLFRKYGIYSIIVIFIIAILFVVNRAINNGSIKSINEIKSNQTNTIPIVDNLNEIPTKNSVIINEKANKLIIKYMEYCNNKKYENAYSLLDEDFKSLYFKELEKYKKYIDIVFKTKKDYNIQSYSNIDNLYIYNIRIMDDLLASRNNRKIRICRG